MPPVHESEAFPAILAGILDRARARGLTARELATRAGIAPETLSRMKARGRGDFAVIDAMARVVGLRLTLVPDDDRVESIRKGEFF